MSRTDDKPWTFLTNHTQVLLCIAQDPDARARDIAAAVGITERAVQRIIADLVDAGYVSVERLGRRNHYSIHRRATMRHQAQETRRIGELLELLDEGDD